jgi:hypothetical protein
MKKKIQEDVFSDAIKGKEVQIDPSKHKLVSLRNSYYYETRIIYQHSETKEYIMLIVDTVSDTVEVKTPTERYIEYCKKLFEEA